MEFQVVHQLSDIPTLGKAVEFNSMRYWAPLEIEYSVEGCAFYPPISFLKYFLHQFGIVSVHNNELEMV